MKLKRAAFKHIEAEIYEYNNTLQAMEELRQDIILASRRPEVAVSSSFTSSIVERRATLLADSALLNEMERITDAIQETYSHTRDQAREIVFVKYGLAIDWQPPVDLSQKLQGRNRFDMPIGEMIFHLCIDESTFHRYRSGFVYGVAERLGWY